ncbi:MAG TPA: MOSC N-terminal beta barrel domain-containing protein [Acidimicrobiales bacterium]|nr:MOSC N-terminal beta barrel domain-containing protein [Acidimicrobiales bacterium]
MRVVDLWRFPVKSLGGEQLTRVTVGELGFAGDRQWVLRNVATGKGLTARREPKLLFGSARVGDDGDVAITLPDGHTDLSEWLGYAVELVRGDTGGQQVFEHPLDFETEAADSWIEWTGPEGVFHDSKRRRVSLVSVPTLGDWDRRRFRTNIVVDEVGEDAFLGQRIRVGEVELDVTCPIDRCVMTTRPQPGLDRDLDVLRTINKARGGYLAIGCTVATTGTIAVGDEVNVA